MKAKTLTKADLENTLNEALADFRVSLNKDMEKFVTKDDLHAALENYPTKDDLNKALSNHPTHKDLASAVLDITDAIDTTMADHLVKHHAIKVLH